MARVLIAGCGYVGAELGARLSAAGHTVWGLRRHADGLPQGIRPLPADLTRAADLQCLPGELDFVVYAAGPDDRAEASYRAAYLVGLRNLREALLRKARSPQRMLFTSSTGIYPQENGEWVDEESPIENPSTTGLILLEAERLALSSPWATSVIRFGGIYGPGRRRMVTSLRTGTATYFDGTPTYTNRIHRDDCAGVLQYLMTLPHAAEAYLGVDCEPADRRTVLTWIAQQLGVDPPRAQPAHERPPAASNKRCRNTRLLQSGYRFLYPTFREGYATLLGE